MSAVATYSRTNSVTYVTDNILKSLKDIIRISGLNPSAFINDWDLYERGISTWLSSEDLEKVVLEVYNPKTNVLIVRWDIYIAYNWNGGDGSFWTDTDQLNYAIRKAGVIPSEAKYDVLLHTKIGRQDVSGFTSQAYRSTDGMIKQSLGGTIEHNGLGGQAAYWRR
jgi:hypothetical protein